MSNEPLISSAVAEKLRTGHKKYSPSLKPGIPLVDTINLFKYRKDIVFFSIHIFKPGIGGLFIMAPVPTPLFI